MKIFIIDDGFDVQIVKDRSNAPRGADIYEAPKGISLWEGATCIMQDCTPEEIIERLQRVLNALWGGESLFYAHLKRMNAQGGGGFRVENPYNPDAGYVVTMQL